MEFICICLWSFSMLAVPEAACEVPFAVPYKRNRSFFSYYSWQSRYPTDSSCTIILGGLVFWVPEFTSDSNLHVVAGGISVRRDYRHNPVCEHSGLIWRYEHRALVFWCNLVVYRTLIDCRDNWMVYRRVIHAKCPAFWCAWLCLGVYVLKLWSDLVW